MFIDGSQFMNHYAAHGMLRDSRPIEEAILNHDQHVHRDQNLADLATTHILGANETKSGGLGLHLLNQQAEDK
jgi:hypothetical protein